MTDLELVQSNADLTALLADGRPFLRCACGFLAISDEVIANQDALAEHNCPNVSVPKTLGRKPWYEYVFSFWGLAFLLIIATAVLTAMGKAHW